MGLIIAFCILLQVIAVVSNIIAFSSLWIIDKDERTKKLIRWLSISITSGVGAIIVRTATVILVF